MGHVHKAIPHESAHLHVSGEAQYIDDIPEPVGTLFAAVGLSEKAYAQIQSMDLSAVKTAEGVVAVLTCDDLPGKNNHGPILNDDPLMTSDTVEYVGQVVFAVVATSVRLARQAARLARIEYRTLEPVLNIAQAITLESDLLTPETLTRGNPVSALKTAVHRLQGNFAVGGQDHFYLEGQISLAIPLEDGGMLVHCSTQHPSEVQHMVAEALGKHSNDVVVMCRRMGGGFGGKETQPALFACIAAVAARRLGKAVKLRVDRDDDMTITGKRHPYDVAYEVGFDENGLITALDFCFASDCGRSADLSGPVNVRTIFHADNCYWLEHVTIESKRLKLHKASNTAFRGFGGPQGMLGIEYVVEEIACYLDKDPLEVRKINFYGVDERNTTPYDMLVEDNIVHKLIDELETSSDYQVRRTKIREFNKNSSVIKKGIALTPVKFGISFTATHYNQAGALIHVYRDGSILLNHGGTEMGQGLYTKVAQVVAEEFQVDFSRIKSSSTDTSKVPNTSATAASAGSDLNGMAAQAAARKIRRRLQEYAARRWDVTQDAVIFQDDHVLVGDNKLSFSELVNLAYLARVSLSATGFYKTPKVHYDADTLRGRPFYYFCYGAAVSEVAIDTLTGESKLLRVDILHDVGKSLNPALDLGQIEGGFMQGVGWLVSEELCWNEDGKLTTHAPSTYKIPTVTDWPEEFNVKIAAWSENAEDTIYRSKAVGEPPLMLAISVFMAIKDAVSAATGYKVSPQLNAPATPEEILRSVMAAQ